MLHFWQHYLVRFLNSTFFFALITLLVGYFAYDIYRKRKADRLREAATVIVSDIKAVISKLRTIKQEFAADSYLKESRYLLRGHNWHKYKYILLPHLTLEQWGALDSFFADVDKYDKAIELNDSYFDANSKEVWVSLHKHYLETLEALSLPSPMPDPVPDIPSLPHSALLELQYFKNLYVANVVSGAAYIPQRAVNLGRDALNNIDSNILISTAGERLIELTRPLIGFWRRLSIPKRKRSDQTLDKPGA